MQFQATYSTNGILSATPWDRYYMILYIILQTLLEKMQKVQFFDSVLPILRQSETVLDSCPWCVVTLSVDRDF